MRRLVNLGIEYSLCKVPQGKAGKQQTAGVHVGKVNRQTHSGQYSINGHGVQGALRSLGAHLPCKQPGLGCFGVLVGTWASQSNLLFALNAGKRYALNALFILKGA